MKPAKHKFTTLKQILDLIPAYLVPKLSKECGVDKQCRSFSAWSHVVAMVNAQLSHSLSLNDICDNMMNHASALNEIRGATPPSRNGLSHANRTRSSEMAEKLFWSVLADLKRQFPKFGFNAKNSAGIPRKLKRVINVVDSTTIQLVANCMDWAKHRRQKAAAKCHMRLDLQTFLPNFALVKSANSHDSAEAQALCVEVKSGEIVVFDKAYIDLTHLYSLEMREVLWVTRSKDNMAYKVVGQHTAPKGNILSDDLIKFTTLSSQKAYPKKIRLVKAMVEVDGKMVEMSFMTNNLTWVPQTICDLYKARWSVEVFFKQIKQTLQLADFLGHNENAVRWQIWTALLTYVLLRFCQYSSKWGHSFSRLFTLIRGVLWNHYDLFIMLDCFCGTAREKIPRTQASVEQLYLTGWDG